jgi:Zn-dependent protease with chaperone function
VLLRAIGQSPEPLARMLEKLQSAPVVVAAAERQAGAGDPQTPPVHERDSRARGERGRETRETPDPPQDRPAAAPPAQPAPQPRADRLPAYLSTHPDAAERVAAIRAQAASR